MISIILLSPNIVSVFIRLFLRLLGSF
jgi:hypothetical protein